MRAHVTLALVAGLGLFDLSPTLANAQEQPDRGADALLSAEDADRLARRLVVDGFRQSEDHEWDAACASFGRAYVLTHQPVVLFQLARAQGEAGHVLAAIRSYTTFLNEASTPRHHRFDAAARRAIEQLRARIACVVIRVMLRNERIEPGNAHVELDGRTLSSEDLATRLPMDPGQHVAVLVDEIGRVVASESFTLPDGARATIALQAPDPNVVYPSMDET